MANTIYRGDNVKGTGTLRVLDPIDNKKMNNYVIPTGAKLRMLWPGDTASVELNTDDGSVTIIDPNKGTFAWEMSGTKSALLTVGDQVTVDVLVIDVNQSNKQTTFEKQTVYSIADRANP